MKYAICLRRGTYLLNLHFPSLCYAQDWMLFHAAQGYHDPKTIPHLTLKTTVTEGDFENGGSITLNGQDALTLLEHLQETLVQEKVQYKVSNQPKKRKSVTVKSKSSPHYYIGRTVRDFFEGHGDFVGKVMYVDADEDPWLYKVDFEDGDAAEYDLHELQKIVQPEMEWDTMAEYKVTQRNEVCGSAHNEQCFRFTKLEEADWQHMAYIGRSGSHFYAGSGSECTHYLQNYKRIQYGNGNAEQEKSTARIVETIDNLEMPLRSYVFPTPIFSTTETDCERRICTVMYACNARCVGESGSFLIKDHKGHYVRFSDLDKDSWLRKWVELVVDLDDEYGKEEQCDPAVLELCKRWFDNVDHQYGTCIPDRAPEDKISRDVRSKHLAKVCTVLLLEAVSVDQLSDYCRENMNFDTYRNTIKYSTVQFEPAKTDMHHIVHRQAGDLDVIPGYTGLRKFRCKKSGSAIIAYNQQTSDDGSTLHVDLVRGTQTPVKIDLSNKASGTTACDGVMALNLRSEVRDILEMKADTNIWNFLSSMDGFKEMFEEITEETSENEGYNSNPSETATEPVAAQPPRSNLDGVSVIDFGSEQPSLETSEHGQNKRHKPNPPETVTVDSPRGAQPAAGQESVLVRKVKKLIRDKAAADQKIEELNGYHEKNKALETELDTLNDALTKYKSKLQRSEDTNHHYSVAQGVLETEVADLKRELASLKNEVNVVTNLLA